MIAASRWKLPETSESAAAKLAAACGLGLPAVRVLLTRGYRTPADVERFLHPRLADLPDPFLMLGMEAAVARIRRAVAQREKILLYGDYDVDGVSSIVILRKMLELLGHTAGYLVPDRLKEGYGMQPEAVLQAAAEGVSLIISVDTGIRALEAVKTAKEAGVDVIITDHHLPEQELPPAVAILNPNQPHCPYPNKSLCGAGVTFKLAQGLMDRENWPPDKIVRFSDSFMVMAAIATVADVVPLIGENRALVKRGLEGLAKTRNHGLRALMEASGFEPGCSLSAGDVGFRIAPRINAAGRMDHAGEVVEMLLTPDESRARSIAQHLDLLNLDRQRACEVIVRQVQEQLGELGRPDPALAGLVFYSPDWHRGVVGIVASRLVELYNRPAIVLGRDDRTGLVQGSGRSIAGFHLLETLESMPDLFIRFGGHKQAVGVTLEEERVAELVQRFAAGARARLSEEDLALELAIDAIVRPDELNDDAAAEILQLAPFGLANRAPILLMEGVEIRATPEAFGRDHDHLRLRLGNATRQFAAKAWKFAGRASELTPGTRVDAAVSIDEDPYSARRGYSPWSLTLKDVRPA